MWIKEHKCKRFSQIYSTEHFKKVASNFNYIFMLPLCSFLTSKFVICRPVNPSTIQEYSIYYKWNLMYLDKIKSFQELLAITDSNYWQCPMWFHLRNTKWKDKGKYAQPTISSLFPVTLAGPSKFPLKIKIQSCSSALFVWIFFCQCRQR